jgi:hypothetical protein
VQIFSLAVTTKLEGFGGLVPYTQVRLWRWILCPLVVYANSDVTTKLEGFVGLVPYTQVRLWRWILCPLVVYANSDDCLWRSLHPDDAPRGLWWRRVCISARLNDVIGVLTSVLKPCNL